MKRCIKFFSYLIFLLLPGQGISQQIGIKFTEATSWADVLEEARAQNKYIFVDCHATWCVPCKMMEKEVFSLQEVGDYMNDNFVNVKLQLDSTGRDSPFIKGWYGDAAKVKETYSVKNYPTFLFFDPQGAVVHRLVGASSSSDFMKYSADALDVDKQYVTLLHKLEKGDLSPMVLRNAAEAARNAYDMPRASALARKYMTVVDDTTLLNKSDIKFVEYFTLSTQTTQDPGYQFYVRHAVEIDSLLGKGSSEEVIKILIANEIADTIKNQVNPNFEYIQQIFKSKYPKYAEELIAKERIQIAIDVEDWHLYTRLVDSLWSSHGSKLGPKEMENYALILVNGTADKHHLSKGIPWIKDSVCGSPDAGNMFVYAQLLYRTDKKQEAISWMNKAIDETQDEPKAFLQEALRAMQQE